MIENDLTMTGTVLGNNFKVNEYRSFSKEALEDLSSLYTDSPRCVGVIFRQLIAKEKVAEALAFFRSYIDTHGSYRKGDSYVEVLQCGVTQFGKSYTEYLQQCSVFCEKSLMDTSIDTDSIACAGILSESLAAPVVPLSDGEHIAVPVVIREWKNTGDFSLEPHDDLSQLKLLSDCHLSNVEHVVAYNCCLQQGDGGDLVLWDMAPDEASKQALKVTDTGYPYPISALQGIEAISISLEDGDCYFIRADFIHGVRPINNGARVTAGRFSANAGGKIVYWT